MRSLSQFLHLIAAFLGLTLAASAQQPPDTASREAYKANLTACVVRAKACDRSKLTKADQDYLTYEMGEKRFSKQDVEEVVGVRMAWLGKEPATVMGEATGHWPSRGSSSVTSTGEPSSSAFATARSFGCTRHVDSYYRSNGTYVRGYDRRGRC